MMPRLEAFSKVKSGNRFPSLTLPHKMAALYPPLVLSEHVRNSFTIAHHLVLHYTVLNRNMHWSPLSKWDDIGGTAVSILHDEASLHSKATKMMLSSPGEVSSMWGSVPRRQRLHGMPLCRMCLHPGWMEDQALNLISANKCIKKQ